MKLQGNIWTIVFGFFFGIFWFFISMSGFHLFGNPIDFANDWLKIAISFLGILIIAYSIGLSAEGWKKGLKYPFYLGLAFLGAYLLGMFFNT